jgi:hypothetical protein
MKKILLVCTILFCTFFFLKWGKKSAVFYGDALGYYYYLPAAFLYQNFDHIESLPTDRGIESFITNYAHDFTLNPATPLGYYMNQYTYGVAFLELPFFAIAHAYEKITGGKANGFSNSYQYLIKFSSIFYVILGLIICYLILFKLYNKSIAFYTCIILLLGSNLLWFTFYQSGMAHAPLFFLYSLLIYATIKSHETEKRVYFITIGLCAGFITIIRPSDILCLFIPIFYGISSMQTLLIKIKFIQKNAIKILLAFITFILPIIPQLLFWKKYSGNFVYYSYGQQSFDFLHPQILNGLLSPHNGWLFYSPMLIISIIGMFFYKKYIKFSYVIYLFFPLYIYIIYSWYCWNYINGFGSRPMVNIYALLSIPMAATLFYISNFKNIFLKIGTLAILILLVSVSISTQLQAVNGLVWSENSSLQFQKQTLFKPRLEYNDLVALDADIPQPNKKNLTFKEVLVSKVFSTFDTTLKIITNDKYITIGENEEFPKINISCKYKKSKFKNAKWIKCSGVFLEPYSPKDLYSTHLLVLDIKSNNECKYWNKLSINNKIGLTSTESILKPIKIAHFETNIWGNIYYFIPLPDNIQDGDLITLSIWNIAQKELLIKSLKLELFE